MGVSIREYARHRKELGLDGGSPWAVQKALKSGRISRGADGKIDPELADAQWEERTDTKRKGGGGRPSLAEARAVEIGYRARLAKLEYEKAVGALTRVDQVKREAFERARLLRDRILAVPGRLAADLAAETDARKLEKVLLEELRAALEEVGSG